MYIHKSANMPVKAGIMVEVPHWVYMRLLTIYRSRILYMAEVNYIVF